jgi:hypothetical protein
VIKSPILKRDRIYALTEYCSLICNAFTEGSRTVKTVNVRVSDILYLKKMVTSYKKCVNSIETASAPRTKRKQFNVAKFHYFECFSQSKASVMASEWIEGLVCNNFMLWQPRFRVTFLQKRHTPESESLLKGLKFLI